MKAKARGKVSPAVDEYLINHAGRMSQRELAAKCGVGTSTVNRRLAELRQEGRLVPKPVESEEARDSRVGDEDGAQDTAGRLRELRDILTDTWWHRRGRASRGSRPSTGPRSWRSMN